MNPITFPGLGLTFHLERIAFSIGSKDIYWYGIIIAIGFLLGVSFASSQSKRLGVTPDDILDVIIYAGPIGVICARIYYVIFYLDLYTNPDGSFDLGRAIAIWDGGLAIYGGIIGGVTTCIIVCLLKKCDVLSVMDCYAFGLFTGQAIGRWGNFFNQEAHGGPTTLPWRMGLTAYDGTYMEVHPTFLYECLWNLAGLAILFFVLRHHRKFRGMLFCFYACWYGLGRFWIEGLRTDSLYFFNTGIRVSQMVALIAVAVFGGILLWKLVVRRK